jgi:hypothetical protein
MSVPGHRKVWAALIAAAALLAPAPAGASPPATRIVYATGKIVPIPASIPHEEGDMVDRRIVPDLRWIAARYPIFITDGYSGPLPDGRHVGCDQCHTHGSDHYNGLAVDIVPVDGGTRCDASWAPITRLAHWAEPVQNRPRPPFRWVGYDGDAGHGCGNHLHLSWNHAPAPEFQLAEWVEVFSGQTESSAPPAPPPSGGPGGPPSGQSAPPQGGKSGPQQGGPSGPPSGRAAKHSRGPTGGVSHVQTGGLSRMQGGGVSPRRD